MLKPRKNEVRKPTRTISGITPVAVMLPPRKCNHGACIYCPSLDVPQSYTPKSPVVMRARDVKYSAYEQVKARIKAFQVMNHPTDKIEMIIMGGTFLQYPKKFQYNYVKSCYDALNNKVSKTLEQAKKLNEKAKHRCVALCIETRPDNYDVDRLLDFGCTRVELGVQIIDDLIYKKVNRGHTVDDVIKATQELRDAGFKIGYHIMPGLPGSNLKKDLKLFKKLFSDERFKPDQLKLYPCQVIPGSKLEKLYWKGKYKPYTKEQTEKILVEMLKNVPRYCRVMRVMREIPPEYLVAGTIKIDLRKDIEAELRKKDSKLKEIRYREVGFALRDKKQVNLDLKLKITKYKASKGDEYFLEIVNKDDILIGLLRLRIKKGSATIRELHIYGKSLRLGERKRVTLQHKGIGKQLIKEAEDISKKNKIKNLRIISGVGVREYYKKLGYELDDEGYMVKNLPEN
ncbi:MAG TPA: tRNA uridine(34) 5-carboxymethylaminomethyl modification radical SAM/GNAT enzyme Elp3 [Candidatus Pacearchaeota archaeon]|nr:oxygen-independent coproporphyrinogen-III oxidase 1 [archaeon BMS3Abin17]HDK42628.1 tRNA uridine(34) 5-carboxymethylaminomethyl modification radical SAM/GNAT enzyme Elp3 [Candidatus Pacearchaeota archaeon]HDZ60506.1 tRNA uridine(34) 5-carboxymethylaminomethyl modification radical SAM/GNAT enzyme Elp3 [Candidatus Pacearchaeota archaeon]